MTATAPVDLKVGDTMRMSVSLIKHLAEMPEAQSRVVSVREIRIEADGTKTLVVEEIR